MKTIYKRLSTLALAGITLTAVSCRKNLDEVNTNPAGYTPTNYDPNYLLTNAQLAYTGSRDFSYETWRANLIYSSTMMQQLATVIGYWAGDKYQLNEAYTAAYWGAGATGAYPEQVSPIVEAVKFTENMPEHKNLHEIARIMRAMILERITDLYGDVPYFDAGLGYYTKNYFPSYDKQQDIYADLLKEVEEATNNLDPAADIPAGDMYYNGDITQWKKFGNTLLLRMAMRLTKIDPETAKTYVTKVVGKTMESNADNAIVTHDASGGRVTVNRVSQVLRGGPENEYVKLSKTYIDFLKSSNDPRLSVLAIVNPAFDANGNVSGNSTAALQKGMPNGYDLGGAAQDISNAPGYTGVANYSSLSPSLLKLNGPTFALTYAESELLLADAAARWNVGGDAATHYKNGVKAAITYLGQYDANAAISDATAENFVNAHPYNPATGLEMINNQFWAATLLNGYEAWCNWRRSGFPVLTPVNYPGNNTNGTIPRRFPYPSSEANTNPVSYKAAHDAVPGGDLLTARVWWDKQ